MGEAAKILDTPNYYDGLFDRLSQRGMQPEAAAVEVAEAYLDGRPATLGKRKTTRKDRDRLFWTSRAVSGCTPGTWKTEAMVLALTRFMSQETVAIDGLLARVADAAPDTLVRAVRYSGLVLKQHSPRSTELRDVAIGHAALTELCSILDAFDVAYRDRVALVEMLKAALAGLTTFELLLYASLYAFERLVPRDLSGPSSPSADAECETAWDAISDMFAWNLRSNPGAAQALNDDVIASSVVRHLRPILFEEHGSSRDQALRTLADVVRLIDAQIELNDSLDGPPMRSATTMASSSYVRETALKSSRSTLLHAQHGTGTVASWSACTVTGSTARALPFWPRIPPEPRWDAQRTRTPTGWPGYARSKGNSDCRRFMGSPTT